MSTSRSTSMPLLVHTMVARKASSTAASSGVNRRVSTGAMFSMTLCFASTSQAPMSTAPSAPHGTSQPAASHSASRPMDWNIASVKPVRTMPPKAISV